MTTLCMTRESTSKFMINKLNKIYIYIFIHKQLKDLMDVIQMLQKKYLQSVMATTTKGCPSFYPIKYFLKYFEYSSISLFV